MQHDIDTLFYEARGGEGGAEFVTPRIHASRIRLFKSADFYRLDSLAVVDANGNGQRFGGNHNEPEYNTFSLENEKGNNMKIFYRNEDDPKARMQKDERVYAGAYGVTFFNSTNQGKGTPMFEEGYHYCRKAANGWGLTNYHIPASFEFSGFHGRYGGRIDKLGIIIERKY